MNSIDTKRLRATVGWLGLLLPWIILILYASYYGDIPPSISATWYLPETVTPFMIILGSSSILLMCYRGYTPFDDVINTITGIAGMCICLFPCYHNYLEKVGTFNLPVRISGTIHNISAAVFFILLAYNVLFLFTKSSGIKTRNKKIRNAIYYICGIGMLLAMIALFIPYFATVNGLIWWVEAFALLFFGVAFLTKADIYPWLFCDN